MKIRTTISLIATVLAIMAVTIVPAIAGGGASVDSTSHTPEPEVVIDTGIVEVEGGRIAISAYAITLEEAGD